MMEGVEGGTVSLQRPGSSVLGPLLASAHHVLTETVHPGVITYFLLLQYSHGDIPDSQIHRLLSETGTGI